MTQPTLSIAHWAACLSYKIESLADFAALVERQLARAAAEKADILLAPEHISEYWMGFAPKDLPLTQEPDWIADRAAEVLPLLQDAVHKTGVALVAGSFSFRDAQSGKCRNRSYMLFPDREAVFHDKFVLTPSEKDCDGWFFETGSTLNVFDWRGLRLSLIICLDVEMPHLAHLLAQEDIDLLLVPSMTTQQAGYHRVFSCARARAIELFTAVAVVGCTGGATGADGKPRETYNGGAAVYIPSEVVFGHTGIFTDLPVHKTADDAGAWLLSKDIPAGKIRDIRRGLQGAPEAWPGVWDAGHVHIKRDTATMQKIC
jgi:predicted amidohydrolase